MFLLLNVEYFRFGSNLAIILNVAIIVDKCSGKEATEPWHPVVVWEHKNELRKMYKLWGVQTGFLCVVQPLLFSAWCQVFASCSWFCACWYVFLLIHFLAECIQILYWINLKYMDCKVSLMFKCIASKQNKGTSIKSAIKIILPRERNVHYF